MLGPAAPYWTRNTEPDPRARWYKLPSSATFKSTGAASPVAKVVTPPPAASSFRIHPAQ